MKKKAKKNGTTRMKARGAATMEDEGVEWNKRIVARISSETRA